MKAAAPDLAIALGYDVAAALEELDQIVLFSEKPRTGDAATQLVAA